MKRQYFLFDKLVTLHLFWTYQPEKCDRLSLVHTMVFRIKTVQVVVEVWRVSSAYAPVALTLGHISTMLTPYS